MTWSGPESPVAPSWTQSLAAAGAPREATYGRRVGAALLDLVLALVCFFVPFLLFGFMAGLLGTSEEFDDRYGLPAGFVVAGLLIFVLPILLMLRSGAAHGQTLGKQAVGLRVVREGGGRVGLGRLLVRELFAKVLLGTTIIWLLADNLWPLADARGQALHDKLASTLVVDANAPHEPAGAAQPDPFGR